MTKGNARTDARTKLAAIREAQRERERLDEVDLARILDAGAALEAARKVFEAAEAKCQATIVEAAAGMRGRGMTDKEIAALAELPVSALRARKPDEAEPAAKPDSGAAAERLPRRQERTELKEAG